MWIRWIRIRIRIRIRNTELYNKCQKVVANFWLFGHKSLDPDPESGSAIRKNAGSGSVSGSALNQCGSETLH